jgi:hypothetical protein
MDEPVSADDRPESVLDRAEIDRLYEVYDRIPNDAPDEWGDVASWRNAISRPDRGR